MIFLAKSKQKYKAGKANYQQTLKTLLDQALNYLKNGMTEKFAVITWMTYGEACNKQDKKDIRKLVKKRIDENNTRRLKTMDEFYRFVESNPFGWESYIVQGEYNTEYWYEIYNIMREALTIRYAGTKTTLIEQNMQEGLDEGPDKLPDEVVTDE